MPTDSPRLRQENFELVSPASENKLCSPAIVVVSGLASGLSQITISDTSEMDQATKSKRIGTCQDSNLGPLAFDVFRQP
jgi:hypothetical protein